MISLEHDRILVDNPEGVRFKREDFFQGRWSLLAYYDGKIYDFIDPPIFVESGAFDEVLYISGEVDDHYMAFPAIGREEAVALTNKLHLSVE